MHLWMMTMYIKAEFGSEQASSAASASPEVKANRLRCHSELL